MAKLILENGQEFLFKDSCSLVLKDQHIILDGKKIIINRNPNRLDVRMVYNAFKTPDGTILESRHTHDYVTHTDKNGKEYMLDGGIDYCRYNSHNDIEWLTLYEDDNIEDIRKVVGRGGYGKSGKDEYRFTYLKDMSNDHLEASIEYIRADSLWHKIYLKEKEYRLKHKIFIKD